MILVRAREKKQEVRTEEILFREVRIFFEFEEFKAKTYRTYTNSQTRAHLQLKNMYPNIYVLLIRQHI